MIIWNMIAYLNWERLIIINMLSKQTNHFNNYNYFERKSSIAGPLRIDERRIDMTKNYFDMKIKDINEYYRKVGGNKRDLFWNRKYMIDEQLGRYNNLRKEDDQIKLEFYFKDDQKANKETLSVLAPTPHLLKFAKVNYHINFFLNIKSFCYTFVSNFNLLILIQKFLGTLFL